MVGDFSPSWKIFVIVAVLFATLHAVTMPPPVRAQVLLDINWEFNYSPLVSGAPNSVLVTVHNTAPGSVRVLSLGISFPWMGADNYLSVNLQKPSELATDEQARYPIHFEVPANVTTGKYIMNTLITYQQKQNNQWVGAESVIYVLDVTVIGTASPYRVVFDPNDARIYVAFALITLIGWYLPRKLRARS